MAAYAAAALILAWIPVLGAFAFTYALIVLMGIGIHSVYGTFLTTVVTAVVGFVPVASVLIWLIITGWLPREIPYSRRPTPPFASRSARGSDCRCARRLQALYSTHRDHPSSKTRQRPHERTQPVRHLHCALCPGRLRGGRCLQGVSPGCGVDRCGGRRRIRALYAAAFAGGGLLISARAERLTPAAFLLAASWPCSRPWSCSMPRKTSTC